MWGPVERQERTFDVLRKVLIPNNNKSIRSLKIVATLNAVAIPKTMIFQDKTGAAVATADTQFYFPQFADVQPEDQLLDIMLNERYDVIRVLPFKGASAKTEVWGARSATYST